MTDLEPTPELIACARRVATREWELAAEDPIPNDPSLLALMDRGYVGVHCRSTRLRLDYLTLTAAGRGWLARNSAPMTTEGDQQ